MKKIIAFLFVAVLSACSMTDGVYTTAREDSGAGIDASKISEVRRDLIVNVGDRVFFDFDQYALGEEAKKILADQAAWLTQNPKIGVTIEGHADKRGTREYNLALGERRANAVKTFLMEKGIDASRIKTISYGKEKPVAFGDSEDDHARNRRSVTTVK